jgi:hypothetical protein
VPPVFYRTVPPASTDEGAHLVTTPRPSRWPRPPGRLRRLGPAAVPLALACALAASTAAPAHPASSPQAAAAAGSQPGAGLQALRLPGLRAGSYTVTLITGDQVILHALGGGRYTAARRPAAGQAIDITAGGGPGGVTSLQAVPGDARALIGSGRLNPGLFDVLYLLAHGDSGPAGRIAVGIQYAGHPGAAALARRVGRLPGAAPLALRPASGQAEVSVAARRAAAFWAALTGGAGAAPGPGGAAGLADGTTRLWLAGHPISSPAGPHPQAAQPGYPVNEIITRTTGPLQYSACDGAAVHLSCAQPFLWGLAGTGLGQSFSPAETCLRLRHARPFPVCTTFKFSFRVPAGIYFAGGNGGMLTTADSDHTLENATVELDVPQFTVAGPTTIRVNADKAQPVTVTAPRPATNYGVPDALESTRTLPDGRWTSSVTEAAYGDNNWWAVPTGPGQRATIGSYTLTPGVTLGRPPVTAFVSGPSHLALHPLYPMYSQAYDNSSARPDRFTGRRTLRLVNAGEGTAADFNKIDARGKLVLIRTLANCAPNPFTPGPCDVDSVLPQQLANAGRAGAAGVLIDAASDYYGYTNPLPVYLDTGAGWPRVPRNIPFAEIDQADAAALASLLARGPVKITVDDSGQSPYAYFLSFDQEGRIPGSLHYAVTRRQLAAISDSYHSGTRTGMDQSPAAFRPNIFFAGTENVVFGGPATLREYYGPLSPDTVWWLEPETPEDSGTLPTLTFFGGPGSRTVNWNEPPAALGALTLEAGVNQAQPGKYWQFCAACRQGNTFYPLFWLVNGANPAAEVNFGGFAPGSIHLYDQAGRQIAPTPFYGLATYKLPPRSARYRLVAHYDSTSTAWHFTSAAAATDQTPPGTACIGTAAGLSTAPCGAAPLVFLRYDAFTGLGNCVTAPGGHAIRVTAYHQAPSAPPVTSLKLWISTNGGASWRRLHVAGYGGAFEARYALPPPADTNGHVSIRAEAADDGGNNISQTILNAFCVSTPKR